MTFLPIIIRDWEGGRERWEEASRRKLPPPPLPPPPLPPLRPLPPPLPPLTTPPLPLPFAACPSVLEFTESFEAVTTVLKEGADGEMGAEEIDGRFIADGSMGRGAGANGGGGGRPEDVVDVETISVFKTFIDDSNISVVTIDFLISVIAAINCPIVGLPEAQVGTLLKLRDANLGIKRP